MDGVHWYGFGLGRQWSKIGHHLLILRKMAFFRILVRTPFPPFLPLLPLIPGPNHCHQRQWVWIVIVRVGLRAVVGVWGRDSS